MNTTKEFILSENTFFQYTSDRSLARDLAQHQHSPTIKNSNAMKQKCFHTKHENSSIFPLLSSAEIYANFPHDLKGNVTALLLHGLRCRRENAVRDKKGDPKFMRGISFVHTTHRCLSLHSRALSTFHPTQIVARMEINNVLPSGTSILNHAPMENEKFAFSTGISMDIEKVHQQLSRRFQYVEVLA